MRKNTLFFLIFIVTVSSNSKSLNNLCESPNEENVNSINEVTSYEFSFCDEDSDGLVDINLETINNFILEKEGIIKNDAKSMIISTENGNLLKINSPFTDNNIEEICTNQISGTKFTDVAVNSEKKIYYCDFDNIYELDNCNKISFDSFLFGIDINSLSFDTQNNLYVGFGNDTKVYRYTSGIKENKTIWHDFKTGSSGGDYVTLNGFLYIVWRVNSSYRLYEVTINENFDYVSHVDLGELPDKTYGLASEYGNLYGVTPSKLYSINLNNFTFSTSATNDGRYGDWWGAAGIHEAIEIQLSNYLNESDAINKINPLSTNWENTIARGQEIYIRIDNVTESTYTIHPIKISVGITPQISKPENINRCSNDDKTNLSQIESQLLKTSQNVAVSYFNTLDDLEKELNKLEQNHSVTNANELIYVKVKDLISDCYSTTTFSVITNSPPGIEPFVNSESERFIDNCYIESTNQGYFKLEEIYNQIVIDNGEYELDFFSSLSDAENNQNQLDDNFYSFLGEVTEIFVSITNSNGCSAISNFFINGNCILTTSDLSNIYFPEFFTPNDDGINDYWNVNGISNKMKTESQISIFDRFGTNLVSFNPSKISGWNGIFNGVYLPSNDYWYVMTTYRGEKFTGHFTLIR